MSAKNIFEEYSLEEISKKTKISPISLRFIKNKEYDKIPRVKFIGFINILQREFKTDLSDLIEEYDQHNPQSSTNEEIVKKPIEKKEKKPYFLISLGILILIIAGYILTSFNKQKKTPPPPAVPALTKKEINKTKIALTINTKKDINQSDINDTNTTKELNKTIITSTLSKEENKTEPILNEPKTYSVTIIPIKKVWFKAKNLTTNKTKQYIISKPKTLPKGDYYLKFGHGMVTIKYANQTIKPNTKKIVQIILKNGEYKYVKKEPRK